MDGGPVILFVRAYSHLFSPLYRPALAYFGSTTSTMYRNTDTSRGSVYVVRAAEVAPKCLLR